MTYETGTATGVVNLLEKLRDFAVITNGWTSDDVVGSQKAAFHKGTVYVSFSYADTSPEALGVYQALGHTPGTNPGGHPDDSGNGYFNAGTMSTFYTNTNILNTGRSLWFEGTGSIPYYAFFENNDSIHGVVEIASGKFRHFGFGTIDKINDWTGGEYCYSTVTQSSGSSVTTEATALLDSLTLSNLTYTGTLHVEDLPGMTTQEWGICGAATSSLGLDRAGLARVPTPGGYRGGPFARGLGTFSAGSQSGKIPMYPIVQWYRNGADVYMLGSLPDVRGCNIREIAPKDEVVIGGDTWVFYPRSAKDGTSAVAGASQYQGIAYRKFV